MSGVFLDLPAFYVDEVVLDDLGITPADPFLVVFNRDPEPGETQVLVGTNISFDFATDAADAPDTAALQVFISVDGSPEVLAYDGGLGGFQPGWDGPDSAITSPDANTRHVVVDPTADFGSLQVVQVRLELRSTAGQHLDVLYSFTIEDLTAPVLSSIKARDKDVLRFTFDEQVVQTSATAGDSALNPANYSFDRLTAADDPSINTPSVPITAVSVEAVTTNVVDVFLDTEMTPGWTYTGTVTGVEDLFGNVIQPPLNARDFVGFQPAVPEDRSFDAWRMIPQKNRDEDPGDLRRFINVLNELCGLQLCLVDSFTNIFDPDLAPEEFLDAILADLGNPFEFDLDETQKRKLIRVLVPIYRQKGTTVGIVNVIRFFLGIEVEVLAFAGEGWDLGVDELGDSLTEGTAVLGPGSGFNLYAFEIESPVALTQEQRDQITDIVEFMKPAHTHFIRIIEPEIPTVIDHLELGLSELGGDEWILH